MTATPNMGLTLPVPGGDTGVWDDELNDDLTLLDGHDHTSGKGARITTAAISIDADLNFRSHAATNLTTLASVVIAPPSAGANLLYWSSADGELYVRDSNGIAVKITNAGQVNVSASGGIGGDYASVGALESYDDASKRFLFQQEGSPRPWAGLAAGNVDIYEQTVSIANRIRLQSPHALAASYALTLPTALPGARSLLQVDSAGVVTATNSIAGNLTLTSSGVYKRGNVVQPFAFDLTMVIGSSGGSIVHTDGIGGVVADAAVTAYFRLPALAFTNRLQAITVFASDSSGGSTFTLMKYDETSTTMVAVTGASGVGIITGAATLTPTSPAISFGIYVLKVVTGTNPCTFKKGELIDDVP